MSYRRCDLSSFLDANPHLVAFRVFKLAVDTPLGELLLPQTTLYIALLGRESRVITTGLTFGRSSLFAIFDPVGPLLWIDMG